MAIIAVDTDDPDSEGWERIDEVLVASPEIQKMMGWNHNLAVSLVKRGTFPKPIVARPPKIYLWLRSDVERWAAENARARRKRGGLLEKSSTQDP